MYPLKRASARLRARARLASTPKSTPLLPTPLPIATSTQSQSRAPIGEFSDTVLLNFLFYFLDVSPRHWPRLVHICRKWRRIVFAFQPALHLRLFCSHRTPVSKTLDCWPAALPIIVEYGGSLGLDPPAREDENNIMAALEKSDRVHSISLSITSSLLEKLSAIKRPLSELEDLVLLSLDGVLPTIPSAFRRGPRLRRLHLTRIALPAFLQLLHSSRNLVDLYLHEVLGPWPFSPEALTNALSGMTQLQSLSLHFPSSANHLSPHPPSESWERITLPVLTRFHFRGIAQHLEGLVARIDAPLLWEIKVTFFDEIIFELPALRIFISRIEMHNSHRRADILSSDRAISISLTQPGAPTHLKIQLFGELLQLSFMSRVCIHFSEFLFNVEDLHINATTSSKWKDSFDYRKWPEVISSFTGVKWFHVAGSRSLSTNIVRDLQLLDSQHKIVLPALRKLYILEPGLHRASLRETVFSFITSRQLSGHPMGMGYARLELIPETETFSPQGTIEMLYEDVLLNIFRQYLHATPQFWPTLVWVCQKWRQIVLTSPLGLNLRLHCTYGTPVLKTLDCWPALPITVLYGGFPSLDPPAPEDDDNIIAALKQSDRVSSISLTVTSSLREKLSIISEPFSELEELSLLSGDSLQLTLPSTFRWGSRLRTLNSTRIAFPSFPQLLLPSQDLVDLQLHEIPSTGYFSPEVFASATSGMTNLQSLSIHFLSLPPRRSYLVLPPPLGERVVLPALTHLKYRGTSKYLDCFVARIDAPRLEDIGITLFSQPTMDASQLGRFIERLEMRTSLGRADVEFSVHATSISFTNSSSSTPLRLQISCKQLDWQLSNMTQICDQLSPFLFRVNNLSINTTESSTGQDNMDDERWLELIRPFGGARDFSVAGELAADILCALRPAEGGHTTDTPVLPALRNLHVQMPEPIHGPFRDAVLSIITSRRLSGRPVELEFLCHICSTSFKRQQELQTHLVDKHSYRLVCSYCSDFECKPGHDYLFRDHLESGHTEVTRNDELFSNPFSTLSLSSELDALVKRHSSLRAPATVAPPTMITASHSQ